MTWKADPLSDPNSGFGPNAPIPCCERDMDGDGTCRTHDTRFKGDELRALQLALMAHGAQTHGDRTFGCHLLDVAREVDRYHLERLYPGILVAAFLHDVIEDTHHTQESLRLAGIPEAAITLAWAVTDEPGKNRAERKAKTYVKIRETPGATQLKVCDRIANVKQCLRDGNMGFLQMYRNEQPGFSEALRPANSEHDFMWNELERLLASEPQQTGEKWVAEANPLVFHTAPSGDVMRPDGLVHVLYEVDEDDPTAFVEQLTAITHAVCGVELGIGAGPGRQRNLSVDITCVDCLGFVQAL